MRVLIAGAIAGIAAFAAAPARAQTPSIRIDIAAINEGAYPDASAVVNAEDTSGAPLATLTNDNFVVSVNGKPATVKSATLASSQKLGIDVLLVMDTSGSMEGAGLTRSAGRGEGLRPHAGARRPRRGDAIRELGHAAVGLHD